MNYRRQFLEGCGPFFILAGVLHFLSPKTYVPVVPDYLPAKRTIIYVSGVAEIAGGVAMMSSDPKVRRGAMWYLLALLAAVLPANVHMMTIADEYPWIPFRKAVLCLRLPFQAVFAAWVVAAARR